MILSKRVTIVLGLALFLLYASCAGAQSTVTPASLSVPRGQDSLARLTYEFSSIYFDQPNSAMVSTSGRFLVGATLLGSSAVPVRAALDGQGSGRATESLRVPQYVIDRAFEAGSATFTFERDFSVLPVVSTPPPPTTLSVSIRITTGAGAELSLRRVHLYFENQRGEITVPRNHKALKAFADIQFNGSGLLAGHWEVDGRTVGNISRHVTFGSGLTLETPEIPALPTFSTGYHVVRLVITSPPPEFDLPQIVYFVVSEMVEQPLKNNIALLAPEDGIALPIVPAEFVWEEVSGAAVYKIEFRQHDQPKPLFSALTQKTSYTIPEAALALYPADEPLLWEVRGFDKRGEVLLESEIRGFMFKNE